MVHVVAWVDHNPRSAGLADALGCEVTFMPWARNGQSLPRAALGWCRSAWATHRTVRGLAPAYDNVNFTSIASFAYDDGNIRWEVDTGINQNGDTVAILLEESRRVASEPSDLAAVARHLGKLSLSPR